ncbi:hypothetical protein TWF718_010141 [Orbilia javanica]|uniref:F-box domain-containing protein n=1 Tax=Orbilia javanica TaxID=47235 RepID=A0AAN8RAU4_9PEZI
MPSLSPVELLPTELTFQILLSLPLHDLKNFSLCSKSCHRTSHPIVFQRIKLTLDAAELTNIFSAFKEGGSLARVQSSVKYLAVRPPKLSEDFGAVIKAYQLFTEWVHLFFSLTSLSLRIDIPHDLMAKYQDLEQRLFQVVFKRLEKDSPSYHNIKYFSLEINTTGHWFDMVPEEDTEKRLNEENREFLGISPVNGVNTSSCGPLTGSYFPNLEELNFHYSLYTLPIGARGELFPLSNILTARETLRSVSLSVVQLNGFGETMDYGLPDGEFLNVKVLRIHPYFMYDRSKAILVLVKLFPNVEDLAIQTETDVFTGIQMVYDESYDSITLFPRVRSIRTFWLAEQTYPMGLEYLGWWELETITKVWAEKAKMLESVVFVRYDPWDSLSAMARAIEARIERSGGKDGVKCLWSDL